MARICCLAAIAYCSGSEGAYLLVCTATFMLEQDQALVTRPHCASLSGNIAVRKRISKFRPPLSHTTRSRAMESPARQGFALQPVPLSFAKRVDIRLGPRVHCGHSICVSQR